MTLTTQTEAAARTDTGLVRRSNQDAFGLEEDLGLYIVCDGMGGPAGGDLASGLAVDHFLRVARQELASLTSSPAESTRCALLRATAAANRAVIGHADLTPNLRGMGSTLVAARLLGDTLTVVNVGDSRAYLIRPTDGAPHVLQLTRDHSWVADQVRLGLMTNAQAERSHLQSVITRAIGAEPDVLADLFETTLQPGDTLLLTSDGLTRHVTSAEIATLVVAGIPHPPSDTCDALIALAKRRGGSDNITCLLLRFHAASL